jgi:hypothetical protein
MADGLRITTQLIAQIVEPSASVAREIEELLFGLDVVAAPRAPAVAEWRVSASA